MNGDEINTLIIIGLVGAVIRVLWLWRREAALAASLEEEIEDWVNEARC